MTYTAPSGATLRKRGGTITDKIATELGKIDTEIDTHKSKFAILTAGLGTPTALATTGVDVADGSGGTYYGVFVAPTDITLVAMHDYLTEAYVKEDDDAKIDVKDDAGTPAIKFTRTLTAEGEAAKTFTSTDPEDGEADVDAGTRLDLVITATKSSSGTGHAVVILEYYER